MIFGCPVYIHVPMEKRKKMEPSLYKGIFVGYNKTSKDYRIFIPIKRKTFVRIYIKFKENLAYQKSSTMIGEKKQQNMKDEQQLVA
jgi:hypothetical protein